ncbi:unnamed protein product, partial [Polarella glacialis]
ARDGKIEGVLSANPSSAPQTPPVPPQRSARSAKSGSSLTVDAGPSRSRTNSASTPSGGNRASAAGANATASRHQLRSELARAAHFCAENTIDPASGRLLPRSASTVERMMTPRSAAAAEKAQGSEVGGRGLDAQPPPDAEAATVHVDGGLALWPPCIAAQALARPEDRRGDEGEVLASTTDSTSDSHDKQFANGQQTTTSTFATTAAPVVSPELELDEGEVEGETGQDDGAASAPQTCWQPASPQNAAGHQLVNGGSSSSSNNCGSRQAGGWNSERASPRNSLGASAAAECWDPEEDGRRQDVEAEMLQMDGMSVASSYQPSRRGLGSGTSTPAGRWEQGDALAAGNGGRSHRSDGPDRGAASTPGGPERRLRAAGSGRLVPGSKRPAPGTLGSRRQVQTSQSTLSVASSTANRRLTSPSPPSSTSPKAASPLQPRAKAAALGSRSRASSSSYGAGMAASVGGASVSSTPGRRPSDRSMAAAAAASVSAVSPCRLGTSTSSTSSRAPASSRKVLPAPSRLSSLAPPTIEEALETPAEMQVAFLCLDEAHVAACFAELDDRGRPDASAVQWQMQLWPRGSASCASNGLSLAVRGIHRRPITSVSLCCGVAPDAVGTVSSNSSWPNWLVSFSSDKVVVWRLDELWKQAAIAAADAAAEASSSRGGSTQKVEPSCSGSLALLLGVSPPLHLPESAGASASSVLLEGEPGECGGSVTARPSYAGALTCAVARGEKVVLFSVQPDLSVTRLAELSFSDPLGNLLLTGSGGSRRETSRQAEFVQPDSRMSVWISGLGGKLWSCDVATSGELAGTSNLAAHPLSPGIAVHCLSASAVAPGRCYVGGSLASVQILDSGYGSAVGRVQIAGEEAPVMAVRSLLRPGGQDEEETLVVLLADGGIFVQDLRSVAGEAVLSGTATLALSLGPLLPAALTSGSPGLVVASAQQRAVHVAWFLPSTALSEYADTLGTGLVQVAHVPLRIRGSRPASSLSLSRRTGTGMSMSMSASSSISSTAGRRPSAPSVPAAQAPPTVPSGVASAPDRSSLASSVASSRPTVPEGVAGSLGPPSRPRGGDSSPSSRRLTSMGPARRESAAAAPAASRRGSSPSSPSALGARAGASKTSSLRSTLGGDRQKQSIRAAAAAAAASPDAASDSEVQVRSPGAFSSQASAKSRVSRRPGQDLSPDGARTTVGAPPPVAGTALAVTGPTAAVSGIVAGGVVTYCHHPHQAWTSAQQAPPSGASTPQMWRLAQSPQTTYQQGCPVAVWGASPMQPTGSGSSGYHAPALQGLASWPPAGWIPPASPAPTSRLSVHSLKKPVTQVVQSSGSVTASPAIVHRPVAVGPWGLVTTQTSRVSLAPPSPNLVQRPMGLQMLQ